MIIAKLSPAMEECLPLSKVFTNFDASDLYSIVEEDYNILKSCGHAIEMFVLHGNDTWPMTLNKTFVDFTKTLTHITGMVISKTVVPLSLDFLAHVPPTLVNLQLNHLNFRATEYIRYLKPLGCQLDALTITSASNLTCFDLVNILQKFWKLDKLDL